MPIALPAGKAARVDLSRDVRFDSGGVSRHEEVTLVGRGITECCRLYGVIERVWISQLAKRLFFHCIQDGRIDSKSAVTREVKRQNRKAIMVTGKARALRNKFRGRPLEERQCTGNSCADFRHRLRGCSWSQQEKYQENPYCVTPTVAAVYDRRLEIGAIFSDL